MHGIWHTRALPQPPLFLLVIQALNALNILSFATKAWENSQIKESMKCTAALVAFLICSEEASWLQRTEMEAFNK
jgi:hypothetical protein